MEHPGISSRAEHMESQTGNNFRARNMAFRCFLATESVSGTKSNLQGNRNNGSLGSAGKVGAIAVSAVIGHNGEVFK